MEQWEETVEMTTSPTIRLMTPLRRLLAEYHDTCEKILDEEEIEVGLWAYKKRPQGLGVLLAADEAPRQRPSARSALTDAIRDRITLIYRGYDLELTRAPSG